jgi:hypothetical protein
LLLLLLLVVVVVVVVWRPAENIFCQLCLLWRLSRCPSIARAATCRPAAAHRPRPSHSAYRITRS